MLLNTTGKLQNQEGEVVTQHPYNTRNVVFHSFACSDTQTP